MSTGFHSYGSELLGLEPELELGSATAVAQGLASQLIGTPDKKSHRIICVYGAWGTGKSHFLNCLGQALAESNQAVCCYRAWEYEAEGDLAAAYIRNLASERAYSFMAVKPQFRERFLPRAQSVRGLAWDIGKVLTGMAATAALPKYAADGLESLVSTLLATNVQERTIPDKTPLEIIHEKIDTIVTRILTDEYPVLYVLVDDLDRCSPDSILKLLEWTKNHLIHKRCTFVLGLDMTATARLVNSRYAAYLSTDVSKDSYGYMYLSKLFGMSLHVPAVQKLEVLALRSIGRDESDLASWVNSTCKTRFEESHFTIFTDVMQAIPRTTIRAVTRASYALPALMNRLSTGRLQQDWPKKDYDYEASMYWWTIALCFIYEVISPDFVYNFVFHNPKKLIQDGDAFASFYGLRSAQVSPEIRYFEWVRNFAVKPGGPQMIETHHFGQVYRVISECQ